MAFELWYDEDSELAFMKILAPLTSKDVSEVFQTSSELFPDNKHRYLLCDVSDIPLTVMNPETYVVIRDSKHSVYDRIAFLGREPITGMSAKLALAGPGSETDSKFFKQMESAIEWLKRS